MTKKTLSLDFDYDFELLSVVSSQRDYRLCWQLNKTFRFDFKRKEDIVIDMKKKRQLAYFSLFNFEDEINFLQYFFFSNKFTGSFLVPELKKVDYFLMIQGNNANLEKDAILERLKNLSAIEAVFETNPEELSSKQNLIFE